uniref:Cystatin domain-containing protein n=1 Tax=Strongyloides papillosus TaxID=174720 RepID=A0A0N5BKR8_STREA
MNKLNVSIFIIFAILISTEAIKNFFKQHKHHDWEEEDPTDSNIVKLGQDSINLYNRKYSAHFEFFQVATALKEKYHGMPHYFLEILAFLDSGESGKLIPEVFFSHVFDKKRDEEYHEYGFHVTKNGDAPSYGIWKEKNPTSSKIKKLAKESVNYYNKEHGSKYSLDCVLRAGKEYVNGLAHYFLKILGIKNCGYDGEVCSEIFYSNIYDNGKRLNHKYNFSVDTKGTIPSF